MKIRNYEDVKAFVATLTPEQLKEGVVIQVLDETSVRVTEMEVNDVDYFYNEDSEGLIPVSEYDPEHWDGIPLEDTEYNTIVPAGSRVFAYDETFEEDDKVTHVIKPYQIIAAMKEIGFKCILRMYDKLVFQNNGVTIEVTEDTALSSLFVQLMKYAKAGGTHNEPGK